MRCRFAIAPIVLGACLGACGPQVVLDDGGDGGTSTGPVDPSAPTPSTSGPRPADSSGPGPVDTRGETTGAPAPTWCLQSTPAPAPSWPTFLDNDLDGQPEWWGTDETDTTTDFRRFVMNPDRTFTAVGASATAAGWLRAFADIDGDGRADAVVDAMPFDAYLADPRGDISATTLPLTLATERGLLLADDLTGDGLADIVTRTTAGGNGIVLQPGLGDGTFGPGGIVDFPEIEILDPLDLHLVDDPRTLVIFYGEWCDFCIPSAYVAAYRPEADGSLTELRRTEQDATFGWLGASDRNGDGEVDVLVHDGDAQTVQWLDAAGSSFTPQLVAEGVQVTGAFDFDLDGRLDLLAEDGVRWGDPTGFGPPEPVVGDEVVARDANADLDGDGWLDIAGYAVGGEVVWTLRPCE